MKRHREFIKSVLLICLLISSMIMSHAVFYDETLTKVSEENSDSVDTKKISTYVIPQSFSVSFGGMSYTRVYNWEVKQQLWGELRPVLLKTFSSDYTIESVERAYYATQFKSEGLLVEMPTAFQAKDLFDVIGGTNKERVMDITISEILFVADQKTSLYVYDKSAEKYYRIRTTFIQHDLSKMIDYLRDDVTIEYRTIADRFSLEKTVKSDRNANNYTLIPFQYDHVVPKYELVDTNVLDETKVVEAIFGAQMSFIKSLVDINGSKIYMYGYGTKVLTFMPNGVVHFKSKAITETNRKGHLVESIAIAGNLMEKFGINNDRLYLTHYDLSAADEGDVTLYFGYNLGSYTLANLGVEKQPIRIKIRGTEVVELSMNTAGLNAIPYFESIGEMYRIDLCMDQNYMIISDYYFKDNKIDETNLDAYAYFYDIHSAIESIDMSYYEKVSGDRVIFTPVWEIVISGRTYLFDAFSGAMMKTYVLGND